MVGWGASGLSAAVSAAEAGARLAVLERAPQAERGGQSRYTEACLRMKRHTEVSDDFEEHLAENGAGYVDLDLIAERRAGQVPRAVRGRPQRDRAGFIATFADEAGPTLKWLEGLYQSSWPVTRQTCPTR